MMKKNGFRIRRLKKFAKQNKARDVRGESKFRQILMDGGIHYQRQKVVCKYIVDFYLPKRNLIIEIDGPYHENTTEYDAKRECDLRSWGYNVIRFKDSDVNDSCLDVVMKFQESPKIYREVKARLKKLNSPKGAFSYPKKEKVCNG